MSPRSSSFPSSSRAARSCRSAGGSSRRRPGSAASGRRRADRTWSCPSTSRRRQLQDAHFFDDVQEALVRARLAPGSLVLEVTESVLVMDIVRVGAVMQRIRDLGVHMALDDFGTGYSSLLYLQGLPIDRLKVDRSFVAGLGSSGQDPTIISTVVDLAHKLGLQVVARGRDRGAAPGGGGDGLRRGPGVPAREARSGRYIPCPGRTRCAPPDGPCRSAPGVEALE